jgi:hypothetical protein
MLVNLLFRIVYVSYRCVGQGLICLPELRELHAMEIGCPPPTYSVSTSELRGDQETPYANTAQTNATELYLASCPALGREEAESDLPGDATKPNADLQRYREPQRMVVLNLSLKTYFHCPLLHNGEACSWFKHRARKQAAKARGRQYSRIYIEKLNAGLRDERPRVSPERKHRRIRLTTLRLSRLVQNEAQRQRAVNCRVPSRGHCCCGTFAKI